MWSMELLIYLCSYILGHLDNYHIRMVLVHLGHWKIELYEFMMKIELKLYIVINVGMTPSILVIIKMRVS
jgi:hypothetical protein